MTLVVPVSKTDRKQLLMHIGKKEIAAGSLTRFVTMLLEIKIISLIMILAGIRILKALCMTTDSQYFLHTYI